MHGIELLPIDTWCFGDGTPFSGGSATQDSWGGLFPPHPPTVVGATRVALALAGGWSGRGRWGADIAAVVGDGPVDLGTLRMRGPFVLKDHRPVFRMPHHVLGIETPDGRWEPTALISPGPEVLCDLGSRRLPYVSARQSGEPLVSARGMWTTAAGLVEIIGGRLPDAADVFHDADLWRVEERVGIAVDGTTRTAEEGALFGVRHARPRAGVGIGMGYDGIPPEWEPHRDMTIPFGGEGRMARVEPWDDAAGIAVPPVDVARVAVILLTPARFSRSVMTGNAPIEGMGSTRVVSAVSADLTRIGGWDSASWRSLPLRSFVSAGSTLFLESSTGHGAVAAEGGFVRIGEDTELGFGLAVAGVWPEESIALEAE